MKPLQFFSNKGEIVLAMAVTMVIVGLLYQGMNSLWEGKAKGFDNKNSMIITIK
ncbi:MAG: hypothetical protein WCD44_01380 [Candidatus Babeliales bacterium]